jgi:hypothetical protein
MLEGLVTLDKSTFFISLNSLANLNFLAPNISPVPNSAVPAVSRYGLMRDLRFCLSLDPIVLGILFTLFIFIIEGIKSLKCLH